MDSTTKAIERQTRNAGAAHAIASELHREYFGADIPTSDAYATDFLASLHGTLTRLAREIEGHDHAALWRRRYYARQLRRTRRAIAALALAPTIRIDRIDRPLSRDVNARPRAPRVAVVVTTAHELAGEDDSGNEPPPPPIDRERDDDQRPSACPTCGARDHWHRRSRPMNAECLAQLGRAAVIRLRGRS